MRLIRAEILKARRRSATWVIFIVAGVLMTLTFLALGFGFQESGIIEFPAAYAIMAQFAFGLGGLLGLVYAAAMTGADWNWGVVRNVIARGESRTRYLLAKGAGLAILLALAMLALFAIGIAMVYITGFFFNVPVGSPLRGDGLMDLLENLALGYPVLIQRAAIGFAVAVLLRSQLAGAVIGVVLFVGESIMSLILTGIAVATRFSQGGGGGLAGFEPIGPEWWQFLPISIGDYVISAAPGSSAFSSAAGGGGLEGLLLKPVPLEIALPLVLLYMVIAVGIAVIAFLRQEIV
jgi:hypothetical protein